MKNRILMAVTMVLITAPALAQKKGKATISINGKDRTYQRLAAGKSRLITVKGPGELRIIHRLRFKPGMSDQKTYRLLVRIDGGGEKEYAYNSSRSGSAVFHDGTLGVPGHLMDIRLQLRRGYHNIEIRSTGSKDQVYFREQFTPKKGKRRKWVALTPSDGSEQVELLTRETIVPYFRNATGKPFTLNIIGPTDLRIFTRIENKPDMRGRINYRLQVRNNGQVINTFRLSSRRSHVTTYLNEDSLVPGRAAEVVIPIPPGLHRLEVQSLDPDKQTILARFMLPREDLSHTTALAE